MTRFLPYLLLPLGVALLEYHGLQFWTVAIVGEWPGWVTWGFAAAWWAWGWAVLLEAGALWCWLQSRGGRSGDRARAAGWTFAGAVLTGVLCTAALWNVAGPLRQASEVSAAVNAEADRTAQRERTAQELALRQTGVPYKRVMSNLLRTQADAVNLWNEQMRLIRSGKVTSDGQARLLLLLQVACVVMGQLLVVAAARALGEQPETEDEDGAESGRYSPAEIRRSMDDGNGTDKQRDGMLRMVQRIRGLPDRLFWGGYAEDGRRRSNVILSSGPGSPLTAGAASPLRTAEPSPATGPGEVFPGGEIAAAASGEIPGEVEESGGEPGDVEPTEPEATRRVKAARARMDALWPMENQQVRAGYLGVSERDVSLLMNHERLTALKRTLRHTKVLSEQTLGRIEQALEKWLAQGVTPAPPIAPRSAARSAAQPAVPAGQQQRLGRAPRP